MQLQYITINIVLVLPLQEPWGHKHSFVIFVYTYLVIRYTLHCLSVRHYMYDNPIFIFRVPCCDVRCDFHIQTMFGSSLLSVVCRMAHVLFILFVCLRIVMYNTYCALIFICLSSSWVPYVASFSGLYICIALCYSLTFILRKKQI